MPFQFRQQILKFRTVPSFQRAPAGAKPENTKKKKEIPGPQWTYRWRFTDVQIPNDQARRRLQSVSNSLQLSPLIHALLSSRKQV